SSQRSSSDTSVKHKFLNTTLRRARTYRGRNARMPLITLGGIRFHIQQAGSGPDVVLIHGVTGDLSICYLCRAMQVLGGSRRVTAYDLRGHGYSDAPPEGYTSADHARDLIALLDHLEIEQASLVGHSFGAVIALHAAVLAPGRVGSLVLSDP